MSVQSLRARTGFGVAALAGLCWLLAANDGTAAPRQLQCTMTTWHDAREQRAENRTLSFIFDERDRTLRYVDDAGEKGKCINTGIGTLEILGSCGSASVRIDRSSYAIDLNTFNYRWNARRRVNQETWDHGESGACLDVGEPPQ